MQKVIIINLNGNAYQLDEDAYDALRVYLDNAAVQLASNPDKTEIIADLEQAIAEKCMRFLAPHKSVVTRLEIEQVLQEMGPVDGSAGAAGAATSADSGQKKAKQAAGSPDAAKRLYRIRETGMIAGICAGIGAYLNVDPTIVRIIVVLLAILTHGFAILVYIILLFVIPVANTSEERAAASGLPFTAQELVDRARTKYSSFRDRHLTSKWWRPKKKVPITPGDPGWAGPSASTLPIPHHFGYAQQLLIGVFIPIFAIIRAALSVLFVLAVISLVRYRSIFDIEMPRDMPLWAGVVILALIYQAIAAPFRIVRHAWSYRYGPYGHIGAEVWGGMIWLGFVFLFLWFAYEHAPMFREFLRTLPAFERGWGHQV
jgi:phage shock protein PspC (stress-responsive transcriptional regulator)